MVQTSIALSKTYYFSSFRGSRLTHRLLGYNVRNSLTKLKCSNMDDYSCESWFSCQMGEKNVF